MEILFCVLRCIPIALQLAGALVVITVLSMSGSISDILERAKVIATIPNEESSRIYINKDIAKLSLEKNAEQWFSATYIILGYLLAVLNGNVTPCGADDMFVVALLAATLWGLAKIVSTNIGRKYSDRYRSIKHGPKTKGVVAYKKVE